MTANELEKEWDSNWEQHLKHPTPGLLISINWYMRDIIKLAKAIDEEKDMRKGLPFPLSVIPTMREVWNYAQILVTLMTLKEIAEEYPATIISTGIALAEEYVKQV